MKSPFKFLDSYQQDDADVFFGRKNETRDLYKALQGVKHLLVFGPSGSGKTSLVECGLRNQFSEAAWFALSVRRGQNIVQSVFARINEVLAEKLPLDAATQLPADSNFGFGQAAERLFGERYQPVYLLFDQFEELLLLGSDKEKEDFFKRLQILIEYKTPCRVLLVMREEFIGHLSEWEAICPSIFQHRFRLEKMGRTNVQAVIQQILEAGKYKPHFQTQQPETLAAAILSKLPDTQREIELAHVQVFLDELWHRAAVTPKPEIVLHSGLVHEEDDLERILDSFLKKQLRELAPTHGDKLPLELLATLITERHTKLQAGPADMEAALAKNGVTFAQPLTGLLRDLEQRRILRVLKVGEQTQYEISHDVLARVVGGNLTEEMKLRERARVVYRVYGERKGLFSREDLDYLRPFDAYLAMPEGLIGRMVESERALRGKLEEEKREIERRRKKAFWTAVVAGILIVIAVATSFWAILSSIEARDALNALFKLEQEEVYTRQRIEEAEEEIELKRQEAKTITKTFNAIKQRADRITLDAEKTEYKAKMLLEASRYLAAKKLPENFDVFLFNDTLNFRGWGIESLPTEIGKLQNLKSLDLGYNKLKELPAEIGALQNLRSLKLDMNPLDTLSSEIGKLKNLQILDLYKTGKLRLPTDIINLQNLQKLDLSWNYFKNFQLEIVKLKKLQSLDLEMNGLESLPSEISNLTSLQSLNLSKNNLKSLSPEIGNLKNLQSLDLKNTELKSLPSEIGNLTNLQSLNLSKNNLKSLPPEIGNLKNLQSLDLTDNELINLPAVICKLQNLQSLYLGHNLLDSLPEEICDLKNLQNLYLSANRLSSLPIESLKRMPKLKKLVLNEQYNIRLNSLKISDIEALRRAMPRCEIVWEE